jgi:serine/threonine-protein kinase
MTAPEAHTALERVGLHLAVAREVFDENVPAGEIVSQSVDEKHKTPLGSTVQVVLSKGPAPVPVPKVVGSSLEEARSALAAWTVKVKTDYSDTVPRGDVMSQEPSPKTKLQPGKTVTILVSLGPRTFSMPNVLGMSRDDAVAKLQALGLRVQVLPVPNSNGTTVVSQIPNAGVLVKAGSTVTIYIGL